MDRDLKMEMHARFILFLIYNESIIIRRRRGRSFYQLLFLIDFQLSINYPCFVPTSIKTSD